MPLVSDLVLHGRLAASQGGAVIPDGSVTTDKLADLAVTSAKLAGGAVTGPKIASDAVTSDKLDVDMAYTVTDGDLTISLT